MWLFYWQKGKSHILLNLGEGLTNETGAILRRVNSQEIEGMKLLGTFCYNPQAVFPIYFVMRVNKQPSGIGYWKKQRPMSGVEAEWDPDNGKYKLYTKYGKEIAGDDIGAYFTFDTEEGEQVEVEMGVSFVSIENARLNLDKEQKEKNFDQIHTEARNHWNNDLSRILVDGGPETQKILFYTSLYHLLLHPNILQDVNGELLIVSQFTLLADCKKGRRPSFVKAGNPQKAEEMYEEFIRVCKEKVPKVEHGVFGADMKVELLNDGPFTIVLDSKEL